MTQTQLDSCMTENFLLLKIMVLFTSNGKGERARRVLTGSEPNPCLQSTSAGLKVRPLASRALRFLGSHFARLFTLNNRLFNVARILLSRHFKTCILHLDTLLVLSSSFIVFGVGCFSLLYIVCGFIVSFYAFSLNLLSC